MNSKARITPRVLRGFRDYLPEAMMPREALIETARKVYRSFGYSPIDTPALEYSEILEGKGSEETDRQLYRFEDQGGRKVGMRFDLTVPLARFVAQHINELGTPFKRYHIATVWRGEKQQRGRYREFMQCDFDTIGSTSTVADIETGVVIDSLLRALSFERFSIRVNNRMVLNGLLEKQNLGDKSVTVLRALDKLAKIGAEKVAAELAAAGLTQEQATAVLELAQLDGTNEQILKQLESLVAGSDIGEAGIQRLAEILKGIEAAGVAAGRVQVDVSIARGLDYYTGVVFETFLDDLPSIGSVCSGGRYDNLAELYTKQQLPGIGASLGLDRLLAAMEELEMIEKVRTPAPVFIPFFDKTQLSAYLNLATRLRTAGIGVELYPDPKKLGQQLKYADNRGFSLALIAGEDELARQVCQVKDLRTKEATEVTLAGDELINHVRDLLSPN